MQKPQVWSLGQEDPLEAEMPPHWKIAWKIPWTEKPGRLQSMGLQRVNMTEQLSTLAAVLSLRSGLGMPPGSLLHSSSSLPSLQRLRFSPPHASCLRKSPLTQPFKNKDLKTSKKTILKGHYKAIQLPIQRQKIFQESDKRKMQLEGEKTDNYFIKLLCYIFSRESNSSFKYYTESCQIDLCQFCGS